MHPTLIPAQSKLRNRFSHCALILLLALPSQVFGLDAAPAMLVPALLVPILTRGGPANWQVVNSQVAGVDPVSLFAPAFAGDGQTANWRIVNVNPAGRKRWAAVGNFLIPGRGGYCTAVLVAPRIVLTANHCLYGVDYNKTDAKGRPGKQMVDAKLFVFVAGVHDSASADVIPVEKVITGGWTPEAAETAKDWVIAILARPAGSDIAPIAIRSFNQEALGAAWRNKLVVAGYPGASFAFNSVLRFSFNCSIVKSASADIVSHDCPSEGGSSGGPILVNDNGELKLIGIHTSSRPAYSRYRDGVSVNAFSAQLNAAIASSQQTPAALAPDPGFKSASLQ